MYYLLAVMVDGKRIEKLSLFSSSLFKVHTRNMHEICGEDGNIHILDRIKNISKEDRDLILANKWDNLNFPIIDINNQPLSNKNNIAIVKRYIDKSDNTLYAIVNYSGNYTILTEENVIEYLNKYNIGNYNIKDGQIIADVETVRLEKKAMVNNESLTICLDSLAEHLDTAYYTDYKFEALNYMSVKPSEFNTLIKKVTLNNIAEFIDSQILAKMKNLEDLEIILKEGSGCMRDTALSALRKLKTVTINSDRPFDISLSLKGTTVEKVTMSIPLRYIGMHTFSGCENLDINSVLVEGTHSIGAEAFFGNKATKKLIIPSTATHFDSLSFDNTQINEIICNSEALIVSGKGGSKAQKLFDNLDATLSLSSNTAFDETMVSDSIELKYREEPEHPFIRKCKVLGLDYDTHKVYSHCDDIAKIIELLPQKEVTGTVLHLLDDLKLYRSTTYSVVNICGLKLLLGMRDYSIDSFSECNLIQNNNFVVYEDKNDYILYPCNKQFIANMYINQGSSIIEGIKLAKNRLQSVDVSEDGLIRAIYMTRSKEVKVEYIDKCVLKETI